MNRPKFTPGPWEEKEDGFIFGPVRKPKNYALQVYVCKVLYPFRPLNKKDPWEMQFPANARLIAAAPDLYDIAYQLVCIGDGMDTGTLPDIIKDARAALEKIGAEPEVEE